MKTLVFTSACASMSLMLVEWAVSLRKLAKYSGDALVLDYGLPQPVVQALNRWNIRTIPCEDRGSIVCTRYMDAVPILRSEYPFHVAAHFDADIWFQAEIDEVFTMAQQRPSGCVFSPDVGWFSQPLKGDASNGILYDRKVRQIRAQYGGTIQGGMSCGLALILARRYEAFAKMIEEKTLPLHYGSDQFAFNWLFDPMVDTADAHLWNCIGTDAQYKDGAWYSRRGSDSRLVVGLHVVGMCRSDETRLFRNCYRALFLGELDAVGLKGHACHMIPSWGLYPDIPVHVALEHVIKTCRLHDGRGVSVGMSSPQAQFSEVGCISLVPLTHGCVHYWDELALPRKPHIQHPDRLSLSPTAVRRLSDTPLSLATELCQKFEKNWFDFMLTMLCASRSLSWGLMWTL